MNWEFLAPLPHSVTVPTRTMTYDSDNRLYIPRAEHGQPSIRQC